MSPSPGLIRGCSGAALGFKTEENENVLRIYGFEGESGGRGRWRRAPPNQNVAGELAGLEKCLAGFAIPGQVGPFTDNNLTLNVK